MNGEIKFLLVMLVIVGNVSGLLLGINQIILSSVCTVIEIMLLAALKGSIDAVAARKSI